jgi:GDP-L-fucose synthase
MQPSAKIYIAGHRGMAGSAIMRNLENEGFTNIVVRTSAQLDLRNQEAVTRFFQDEQPEYVFLAAAKVGGIMANNIYRADFLYENLMIQSNVIHQAYKTGVKKLLFLGSSCIYPKMAPQPIKEEYLLTASLEPTNEPYAIAKIAGLKMCETYNFQYGCNYIAAMPTNLYGPNDNYDLHTSHVLPALINKFHAAKENGSSEVVVWGTGTPKREFMHVDDMAAACVFLMKHYNETAPVNIGVGEDVSIKELAHLIKEIVGFKGAVVFDSTKPDGTPRKLLDVSRLAEAGWQPSISLADGIASTYEYYVNHQCVKPEMAAHVH